MNILKEFPDREVLLSSFGKEDDNTVMKVNNHIHTPYSFSAFHSIQEAIEQALDENIRILGINDFYVADGYREFVQSCVSNGIFPLLNLELIGVSHEDQREGIRINDPKNPGRIYVSGKGFDFPFRLPVNHAFLIQQIVEGSNKQVTKMISLLNEWIKSQGVELELSASEIKENYAMKLLRERHVARRLRLALSLIDDEQEYSKTLTAIYDGQAPQKSREDIAGTEDELRSRLLKAGAPAFVPEDDSAFLPLLEIMKIIESAGGIPCYPMLLDGAGEHLTEFESTKERLKDELDKHGFTCVELIPHRNEFSILKEYAEYFYEQGFVVSFGTEHNTSARSPLTVTAKGGAEPDDALMQISYNGAAWQAAHQYLLAKEGMHYEKISRQEMETLGKAVFRYYFHSYKPTK